VFAAVNAMARVLALLESEDGEIGSWLWSGSRMGSVGSFVVGGSCAAVERCTDVDRSFRTLTTKYRTCGQLDVQRRCPPLHRAKQRKNVPTREVLVHSF
jgi:hypothetical protein